MQKPAMANVLEQYIVNPRLTPYPVETKEFKTVENQNIMIGCSHFSEIRDVVPSADGCEDCLKIGGRWVHLRLCESCGHVGCCDNSPNRHATRHYHSTAHPIIKSFEPNEEWGYCYPDEMFFKQLPSA